MAGLVAPALDVVRWGLVGLGERGHSTLSELLLLEHCEIAALCDVDEDALRHAAETLTTAGARKPGLYGGRDGYRRMLERDDIDAVVISTPWRSHTPMAVAALRAGKHAFVEVPAAVSVEECWQLVETAEECQRHCMMLENCCYGREELMVLNLCRQGILGELLHGEGAYIHDLRHQMRQVDAGTGSWRVREHMQRNGNLYPTHGLGPIAQYMSINRGDVFATLVSISSPSLSMPVYAGRRLPSGHPRQTDSYICGDINTSLIKTARGRSIVVQHNTMTPHPYSRSNVIQGTQGVFAGFPDRIYVDGRSPEHEWETDLTRWYAQFDHPLWTRAAEAAEKLHHTGGHGGMDFVMMWRIVQCLREGLPLDQDVYDAAAWSVIGPLSDQSVAQGGAPVPIPDFTRGAWKTTPPLSIVS